MMWNKRVSESDLVSHSSLSLTFTYISLHMVSGPQPNTTKDKPRHKKKNLQQEETTQLAQNTQQLNNRDSIIITAITITIVTAAVVFAASDFL